MRLYVTVVAIATVFLAASPTHAQRATACNPSRYHRDLLMSEVRDMMDTDDAQSVSERLSNRLPLVPLDSIRIVTNERICERAARAYYRRRLGPRPPDGATVVQVGDLYVVYGRETGSHYELVEVFTKDFERVAGFLI